LASGLAMMMLGKLSLWFYSQYSSPNRNVSEPLVDGKQTNQRAELTAIGRAIDIAPIDRNAMIYTDSYYSIKCLTEWFQKWEKNEWKSATGKPVENKDIIEPIIARIREREMAKATTKFTWVKGHGTNEGNIGADALATQGAKQSQINAQLANASVAENDAAHVLADYAAEEGQAQIHSVLGSVLDHEDVFGEQYY
jgi:ribonuclease HI